MKALFKYQRTINGNTYTPGSHELPDFMADHWFFKALVACGDAELITKPKASSPSAESVSHSDSAVLKEVKPKNTGFIIDKETGHMRPAPKVEEVKTEESVVESEHTITDHSDGAANTEAVIEKISEAVASDATDLSDALDELSKPEVISEVKTEEVKEEKKAEVKAAPKANKGNAHNHNKKKGR